MSPITKKGPKDTLVVLNGYSGIQLKIYFNIDNFI